MNNIYLYFITHSNIINSPAEYSNVHNKKMLLSVIFCYHHKTVAFFCNLNLVVMKGYLSN